MADGGLAPQAPNAEAAGGVEDLPSWLQPVAGDPVYEWAVLAWRRAAAVPGAWFDHALADEIIRLWPTWATLTTDRFAGVPFRLLLWQELIVRLLVGWTVPTEVLDPLTHEPRIEQARLFRRLLLWIPRKNGKTEFLSALVILFAVLFGIVGGEGYLFARDEAQARKLLNNIKAMVSNSAELRDACISYKRSVWVQKLLTRIELLTGAEEGKHGRNPSVIAGDEIHEWRSRTIEQSLRQGTGARLEPIELYASTTGKKSNAVGVEVWEETRAILEGRISDPTTLPVIFAAPADADYRDEEAWRLANPSLGLSPTIQFLRREAAIAADNARAEAAFRCYHLNQWIEGEVRWLNLKKWDACASSRDGWKRYPQTLKGRRCFGAFDVSSTQDVTALVLVFPPTADDPKWRMICRCWVPEESLAERVRRDRVDYDKWRDMGALETTPGDFVDQNAVKLAVLEAGRDYDLQLVGYDPWNAGKLVADLQDEGMPPERLVLMRQGIATLGEPTKHFERLVYAGQLDHGGHPVLRWMAGNAVVRFDENLNFAPAKKRSAEKIDGIVAGVMAVGLACNGEEPMDLDDFLANAVIVS